MDLQLKNKVALITGGSRGIGRAIAVGLVKEGVKVAICARDAKSLEATAAALRKEGGDVVAEVADISKDGEIERVTRKAVEKWGRLDIVVNNAGGPPPGRFDHVTNDDWRNAVELGLLSAVRTMRAALPHLKESGGGRVINVLSTSVKESVDGMMLSNSMRTAVAGLAKTMSRELGPFNITVNNVCPAHVMTARLREVAAFRAKEGKLDTKGVTDAIALRRMAQPAEVADLVTFLVSGRAGYITGTSISIDGGSTISLM
ncbi:MAG TPA: SDR family oxidoreductase [Thermoanaerobaculia bacterium]